MRARQRYRGPSSCSSSTNNKEGHFSRHNKLLDGTFSNDCQARSVPVSLRALVGMIIDGPCCKKEDCFDDVSTTTASLSISQLISFHCVKRRSTRNKDELKPVIRHNRERETPLPLYVGLKIRVETKNKGLIETMCKMGLSISYDRVMSIPRDAANSVCSHFEQDCVVYPPKATQKSLYNWRFG